jgi:hypothetical protein
MSDPQQALYAIVKTARQVVKVALALLEASPEPGGPYEVLMEHFARSTAALESLFNPDNLPVGHPARGDLIHLVSSGAQPGLRRALNTLLGLHDQVFGGWRWGGRDILVVKDGVFAGSREPSRVLEVGRQVLDEMASAVDRLEHILKSIPPISRRKGDAPPDRPDQGPAQDGQDPFVTLLRMAALVNRTKRALEHYLDRLPDPDVEGGGGKPHEWRWSRVRPHLERLFGRSLPEQLPDTSRR